MYHFDSDVNVFVQYNGIIQYNNPVPDMAFIWHYRIAFSVYESRHETSAIDN